MRLRALRRSIVLAALFVTALPAGAHAGTGYPAIAVGTDGTAHVSWLQDYGSSPVVLERRREAAGTLTDAQFVSSAGRYADVPLIAADSSGNAIIAWSGSTGTGPAIFSRRRTPDGALGPVQRISPPGTSARGLAFTADSNGNAVYAWVAGEVGSTAVQTRRRTAGGLLSATQTLSTSGSQEQLKIGMDSAGNAVISWLRRLQGSSTYALLARRRAVDGALSPVQTVAAAAYESGTHDLAVAADGRAAFTWSYHRTSDRLTMGRTRAADGTLGTTQTISPVGEYTGGPKVAIDPTGRVLFTWGGSYGVQGRARSAAGALGSRFVVRDNAYASPSQVDFDADGNALFAWLDDDPADGLGVNLRVQVRRRTPAGAMSAVQDISTHGVDAADPVFGFDANGAAVIAWTEDAYPAGATIHARRRTALGELSPIAKLSE